MLKAFEITKTWDVNASERYAIFVNQIAVTRPTKLIKNTTDLILNSITIKIAKLKLQNMQYTRTTYT